MAKMLEATDLTYSDRLNIRVSKDVVARVERLAAKESRTASNMARVLLEEALMRREKESKR